MSLQLSRKADFCYLFFSFLPSHSRRISKYGKKCCHHYYSTSGTDYSDEISRLAQLGFRAEYIPLEGTNDIDRIANALSGFQYAMIGPELWSAETFDRLPEIRMLARLGAGVDQIDLNAASKHGVPVCSTPGANACSVAQYALTFMLCLATKTARYDRSIRQGVVTRSMTGDLIGKTVGLVGFGNVGRQLALLLTGLGVAPADL